MRYIRLEIEPLDKQRRITREGGDVKVRNAICGDKELLLFLLSGSPNLGKGQDLIKLHKYVRQIEAVDDPGILSLTDEAHEWIGSKILHEKYDVMGRTAEGQEVPMYSGALKLKIGDFLGRWMTAPEDIKNPEEDLEEEDEKFKEENGRRSDSSHGREMK